MDIERKQGNHAQALAQVDVAVLAGGLGTRIREVLGDTPKVLALIDGRPYLEFLFDWLQAFGARRIVLCLGHLADHVESYILSHPRQGLTIETVIESEPLGTAGALRLGRPQLRSDPVLILNGDTFIAANLGSFLLEFNSGDSSVSLLCVEVASVARYGLVELGEGGQVARFREKDPKNDGPGLINGGVYLFSQSAMDKLAQGKGPSLEKDFFATMPRNSIGTTITHAPFVDIGLPESLAAAQTILPEAWRAIVGRN